MATEATITRVGGYWDDQPGVEPGWYLMAFDRDGDMVDDSQKVWFPVTADNFGRGDRKGLTAALREAFPGAEIQIQWMTSEGGIAH